MLIQRVCLAIFLAVIAPMAFAASLAVNKDFVHVCTDAGAGAYEAFPDVCRMADGRLLCVFYAGYGHVALPNAQLPLGGRVVGCYSSDEGRTWSATEIKTRSSGVMVFLARYLRASAGFF